MDRAVYVMEADGSNLVQLTTNLIANISDPSWSPDGDQIVFAGGLVGHVDLHVVNADGSNVHQLIRRDAVVESPAWSPDGAHIMFTLFDPNLGPVRDLWRIDPDGFHLTQIMNDSSDEAFGAWESIDRDPVGSSDGPINVEPGGTESPWDSWRLSSVEG